MAFQNEICAANGLLGDYLEFNPNANEASARAQSLELLYKAIHTRRLVVFIGSGVSSNSGLPSWKELAQQVAGLVDSQTAESNEGFKSLREGDGAEVSDFQLLSESLEQMTVDARDFAMDELAKSLRARDVDGGSQEILRLLMSPPFSVSRFVTTNYDDQIERAFDSEHYSDLMSREQTNARNRGSDVQRTCPKSLVLTENDSQDLLLLALGAPGFDAGVIHLHGHYKTPRTILVTESDYQRVYMSDSPIRDSYSRALRLLFACNPVLFVGVGMTEPDLLRPLRYFASMRQPGSREPLWFALMREPPTLREQYTLRKKLFRDNAVKVIYFSSEAPAGAKLTQELKCIGQQSIEWYHQQRQIPALRLADRETNSKVYHHRVNSQIPYFDACANRKQLTQALANCALVVLHGKDGAGKNSLAQELSQTPEAFGLSRITRRLCVSAKFRNGFSAILEAAAAHFVPNRAGVDGWDGLIDVLERENHLLILDGFERLLDQQGYGHQNSPAPISAISSEIQDFIDKLAARVPKPGLPTSSFAGRVVLVSRTIPTNLGPFGCELSGLTPEEIRAAGVFSSLEPRLVDDLSESLGCHAYALALIGATLEAMRRHERSDWLKQLLAVVDARSRLDSANHVIEYVIETRRRDDPDPHPLWWALLQRVAMVTTPLNSEELSVSMRDKELSGEPSPATVELELQKMSKWRLLLPFRPSSGGMPRYTAHTRVRALLQQWLGAPRYGTGEPHRFVLPGFVTSEEVNVPTSAEGHQITATMADNLLSRIEERITILQSGDESAFRGLRHLSRAAFGLLRARWMAVGLSKLADIPLSTFQRAHCFEYATRLIRLYRAVVCASSKFNEDLTWTPGQPPEKCRSELGILYSDELSWLLNELTLLPQLMGNLYDAKAIARLGTAVANVANKTFDPHAQRLCQTGLNSISIAIDLGNLRRADRELMEIAPKIEKLPDLIKQHLQAVRTGYQGMLHHFRGEYELANKCYDEAISKLEQLHHHRALTIFLQHQGELQRELGDHKEATRLLKKAVTVARLGNHIGQVHMARLRLLSVNAAEKRIDESVDGGLDRELVIGAALNYAELMGTERVAQAVYRVETILAHANHDILRARESGYRALELAAKLGMRREVAQLLRLLGSLTLKENRPRPAEKLLRAAAAYAKQEQYHAKSEEVEAELLMALQHISAAKQG